MKRLAFFFCYIAAVGLALRAFSGSGFRHLMRPIYGEPTLMRLDHNEGVSACEAFTAFIEEGDVSAFTAMCWMRVTRHPWINEINAKMVFVQTCFSVESARSTTEGGAGIADLLNDAYMVNPIPLSAGGTWQASCLPSGYDCPDTLRDRWGYGCFVINLTTDTPLTLTVGGAELYIPATNCMIRNIIAETTDRTVTIAAENENASINFGIGVNPLVQFCGGGHFSGHTSAGIDNGGGLRTHEWRLVVLRAKIENGKAIGLTEAWNATDKFELGETSISTTLAHPRTTFARDARVRMQVCNMAGGLVSDEGQKIEIGLFGGKIFEGWLTDGEIEKIRDIDVNELRRRGVIQ